MADTTEPTSDETKKSGTAITGYLALFAVIAFFCFGGYLLYGAIRGAVDDESQRFGEANPPNGSNGGGNGPRMFPPQRMAQSDFVKEIRQGAHRVRASACELVINHSSGKDLTFRLQPDNLSFLTQEERDLMLAAGRIVQDRAMADALKVTKEQIQKLRAVPRGQGMTIDPAHIESLTQLWNAYETAGPDAKDAAEKALIAGTQKTAVESIEPTKKAVAERVVQLKEILSKEQVDQFLKMGK